MTHRVQELSGYDVIFFLLEKLGAVVGTSQSTHLPLSGRTAIILNTLPISDAHWIIMKPAKKATNITLSPEVYQAAKNLGINISQVCEQRLLEEIQSRKKQQWNEQHADFLAAYNQRVEEEGLALIEWRTF